MHLLGCFCKFKFLVCSRLFWEHKKFKFVVWSFCRNPLNLPIANHFNFSFPKAKL
jgi:hypothetical protein